MVVMMVMVMVVMMTMTRKEMKRSDELIQLIDRRRHMCSLLTPGQGESDPALDKIETKITFLTKAGWHKAL